MTTVVARDGCMAADTQLSGMYKARAQKVIKLPDGSLVGGAGRWSHVWKAIDWLIHGKANGEPDPTFEEAVLLLMKPDGTLWMAEDHFPFYPLLDDKAAIGSGSVAAMAAMELGMNAIEACKFATTIDCGSTPPIIYLKLSEPPKKAKKSAKKK